MFEKVEQFQTIASDFGYVGEMVFEAMQNGRPAGSRRAFWDNFYDVRDHIIREFQSGREWVEYDWRFLNGRAYGIYCFHSDGTLYGAYRFI